MKANQYFSLDKEYTPKKAEEITNTKMSETLPK